MLNKNSLQGLLIALFIGIISFFIYKFYIEKNDEFLLDNPNKEEIKVLVNGKSYLLAGGQSLSIPVNSGKNTISCQNKQGNVILKDTFFVITKNKRGLINPSLATYFTFKRYYGHIKNRDSIYRAHRKNINGKEFLGEIGEYNQLVIQDFYYNINQNFPKIINKVDSIESRIKLFRKNQFLEFYRSTFE